jgi:hypothetical protein
MQNTLKTLLGDIALFSRQIIGRPLRPYQLEPARAIYESVLNRDGRSVSVMMARQAGKNELSAQMECFLLNLFQKRALNLVKSAPTFKPQIINSKQRLEQVLQNPLNQGKWRGQYSYQIRLGNARCLFFSAEEGANVVGATAHLLLEFDEAQDISIAKHDKDFMPMGATTNCTRAYYGTPWDDRNLLEEAIRHNQEQERRDGIRRHFEYPWWVVAEHNPLYGRFVEAERDRLGEGHPLFKTQYKLERIGGQAGFLSSQQRAQMLGDHPRQHRREDDAVYVAGIDIAGVDEAEPEALLRDVSPRRDSTVITIGRLDFSLVSDLVLEPRVEVVEHYCWTGEGHRAQYERMLDVLRSVWDVQRVVVDATGIGAGVADFLRHALGEETVETFVFTAPGKSRLGFDLLTAVNSGRLKIYAPDGSDECRQFWQQMELARYAVRHNQQINFFVPERDGHDDFLISLALLIKAATGCALAPAGKIARRVQDYQDGRF